MSNILNIFNDLKAFADSETTEEINKIVKKINDTVDAEELQSIKDDLENTSSELLSKLGDIKTQEGVYKETLQKVRIAVMSKIPKKLKRSAERKQWVDEEISKSLKANDIKYSLIDLEAEKGAIRAKAKRYGSIIKALSNKIKVAKEKFEALEELERVADNADKEYKGKGNEEVQKAVKEAKKVVWGDEINSLRTINAVHKALVRAVSERKKQLADEKNKETGKEDFKQRLVETKQEKENLRKEKLARDVSTIKAMTPEGRFLEGVKIVPVNGEDRMIPMTNADYQNIIKTLFPNADPKRISTAFQLGSTESRAGRGKILSTARTLIGTPEQQREKKKADDAKKLAEQKEKYKAVGKEAVEMAVIPRLRQAHRVSEDFINRLESIEGITGIEDFKIPKDRAKNPEEYGSFLANRSKLVGQYIKAYNAEKRKTPEEEKANRIARVTDQLNRIRKKKGMAPIKSQEEMKRGGMRKSVRDDKTLIAGMKEKDINNLQRILDSNKGRRTEEFYNYANSASRGKKAVGTGDLQKVYNSRIKGNDDIPKVVRDELLKDIKSGIITSPSEIFDTVGKARNLTNKVNVRFDKLENQFKEGRKRPEGTMSVAEMKKIYREKGITPEMKKSVKRLELDTVYRTADDRIAEIEKDTPLPEPVKERVKRLIEGGSIKTSIDVSNYIDREKQRLDNLTASVQRLKENEDYKLLSKDRQTADMILENYMKTGDSDAAKKALSSVEDVTSGEETSSAPLLDRIFNEFDSGNISQEKYSELYQEIIRGGIKEMVALESRLNKTVPAGEKERFDLENRLVNYVNAGRLDQKNADSVKKLAATDFAGAEALLESMMTDRAEEDIIGGDVPDEKPPENANRGIPAPADMPEETRQEEPDQGVPDDEQTGGPVARGDIPPATPMNKTPEYIKGRVKDFRAQVLDMYVAKKITEDEVVELYKLSEEDIDKAGDRFNQIVESEGGRDEGRGFKVPALASIEALKGRNVSQEDIDQMKAEVNSGAITNMEDLKARANEARNTYVSFETSVRDMATSGKLTGNEVNEIMQIAYKSITEAGSRFNEIMENK